MFQKTESKLRDNQYLIKKYHDNSYKLIYFKTAIKTSGYEDPKRQIIKKENNEEYEKEESNISRARSKIWEYASCNKFDYFITLTLDKNKMDRYDLEEFIKKLGQYIRNNRRKTGSNIQYLLIPEQHKDGAYHMHGLINGINKDDLVLFTQNDNVSKLIKIYLGLGRLIYNWVPYQERFGFVTVEKIKDRNAVAKYITKYVKKDLGLSVKEMSKKSYYCSRGLKKAEIMKKGTFPTALGNILDFNFENDFVGLIDLNSEEYNHLINLL